MNQPVPVLPLILTFSPAAKIAAKAKESILALLAGRGQGEGHENTARPRRSQAAQVSLPTTRRRLRQSVLAPPLILTFSPAAMAAKAKGQDWY